jgi:hypothetical protein
MSNDVLTPHPSLPPTCPNKNKLMSFCAQSLVSTLQQCSECKFGVWNLYQPFLDNPAFIVCEDCFEKVKKNDLDAYLNACPDLYSDNYFKF